MWQAFVIGLGAGLAATPHCLGMCGGFPLHLAKSSRSGLAGLRQALFVFGKSFTYIFLGALAGAFGMVLFKDTSAANVAPAFRLAAGIVTTVFGLLMLGLRPPRIRAFEGTAEASLVRSLFSGLLHSPSPLAAFALGLGAGFLPCPLPMAMLAVAAGSHSVVYGMVVMAGVGLGTAPGLLAVGLFGVGIDRKFAKVGMRVAGILVTAIGLLTVARVTGAIEKTHPIGQVVPPCCEGYREP